MIVPNMVYDRVKSILFPLQKIFRYVCFRRKKSYNPSDTVRESLPGLRKGSDYGGITFLLSVVLSDAMEYTGRFN